MARLTPFTSTTPVTPAIQQVQADPAMYSQASIAQAQAAGQMGDAFQTALARVQQEAEKPDPMYLAQAHADMSTQMFKVQKDAQANAKPGDNMVGGILSNFDSIGKGIIQNAPNRATQQHLMQSLIGYRGQVQNSAMGHQAQLDAEHNIMDFHNTVQGMTSIVQSEPGQLQGVLSKTAELANAMKAKGMPATTVDKAFESANKALNGIAATTNATQNPLQTLADLHTGVYDHMGANEKVALTKSSLGTLKAQQKTYEDTVDGYRKMLMERIPVPENFQDQMKLAESFHLKVVPFGLGLKSDINSVNNLNKISETIKTFSIPQLEAFKDNRLDALKSIPGLPASELTQAQSFLDARIKSAKEDPMGYAANAGIIPSRAAWPKYTPGDMSPEAVDNMKKLSQYARISGEALGTKESVSPLDKGTVDALVSGMDGMAPNQQLDQIKSLGVFGADGVKAILDQMKIAKHDAVATAIEIAPSNKDLSLEILQGKQLLNPSAGAKSPIAFDAAVNIQRQQAASRLGAIYPNDPDNISRYLATADAVYANRQVYPTSRSKSYDSIIDEVSAVTDTNPGWFTTSHKTVLPDHSYTKDEFISSIGRIPSMVNKATNGVPSFADGSPVDFTKIPAVEFSYKPLGDKKYIMTYSGLPIMNQQGDTLVVDFNNIPKK